MKFILILLLPLSSLSQSYEPDSIGYSQPWLSDRGQIVWINTMQMDIRNVEFDTLDFFIQFQFPANRVPYYSTVDGVRFEPTMGLPCRAYKARRVNGIGQAWQMIDPLNRPIEYLLVRGYKTLKITQTGQR